MPNLIVRLYRDVPIDRKPVGIPDDWPAEVSIAVEGTQTPSDCILMSDADFEVYRNTKRPLYLAWRESADLPAIKESKFKEIDKKTSELIDEGFLFSGKWFSLSLKAQSTYSGLYMIRNEPVLSFPVTVNTIDDSSTHSLLSPEEIQNFYLSAVNTYRQHLDSGTDLKDAIRNAMTATELDAVKDTR